MSYIVENVATNLVATIRTTGFVSDVAGTLYALIRLEDNGHADDALFWDHTNSAWASNAAITAGTGGATWPEWGATVGNGQYVYSLPAAATTSRAGASIYVTATDNQATPASEASFAPGVEYLVIPARDPGLRAVTLHTQTSAAVAIASVALVIKNSADAAVITTGTTDSSGDLVVFLDDGTYSVTATKSGSTFTDPTSVTITATATHNISAS